MYSGARKIVPFAVTGLARALARSVSFRSKSIALQAAVTVFLCFLSGGSLLSPGAECQVDERGVGVRTVSRLPDKAKRYALIIGIDYYQDAQINSLRGAANDAKELANTLIQYGGFPAEQVVLLTSDQAIDRQPTRGNILRRLSNLSVSVPQDGLLLLSFAGHGIEKGGKAFLLPTDAQVSGDLSLLEETSINVELVRSRLRQVGVGQVIVILDSCRNNPLSGRGESEGALTQSYIRGFQFDLKNSGINAFATLYATEAGYVAYEYVERKQGYFTWALVKGLKGGAANNSGEVTLGGLLKYIQELVPKQVLLDLGQGKQQRPWGDIQGYKADELIITVVPSLSSLAQGLDTNAAVSSESGAWHKIKDSSSVDDFKAFLRIFPSGQYADLAKGRIARAGELNVPSAPGSADSSNATGSASLEEARTIAKADLQNGKYAKVVTDLSALLKRSPDDAYLNLLLGWGYYYSGKYSESIDFMSRAVSLGEKVVFQVKHRHRGPGLGLDEDLCKGELELQKGSLAFRSPDLLLQLTFAGLWLSHFWGSLHGITYDRRIGMPRTLFLVFLAVAMSPVVFGQGRRKTPQPSSTVRGYQGIIGQKEAVFTFPITPGRQYEWCPGGLQYGWYVEVKNNRRDFDFGFYLFTAMGAAPCGEGELQHLLEAGQFSVMGTGGYREGTEQYRVLSNQAAVAGFANQSRDKLTIKLSCDNAIRLLFSGKPQYCVFKTKIRDKEYSTRVPLVYESTATVNALVEKRHTHGVDPSQFAVTQQPNSNSSEATLSAARPSFSPDGSKIAYIQFRQNERDLAEHRLCIADLTNGTVFCFPTDLKTFETPAFSPDGKRVIFVSNKSNCASVFVSNLDATNIRQLSSCGTHPTWPVFSPDGKYVGFRDILDNKINIIDLDGRLVARLPSHANEAIQRSSVSENTRGFAFSRNGRQVVYVSNSRITHSNNIYLEDIGDQSRRLIAGLQKETFGYSQVGISIDISPDGRTVAFTMPIGSPDPYFRPHNEYNPEQYKIFTTALGSGTRVRLTNGSTLDTDPVFTPDGRQIVFTSIEKGRKDGGGIYIMSTSGNNRRLVARVKTPTTAFSVSPDGKRIAFEDSLSPNHDDLFIINMDGTGRTRLRDLMKQTDSLGSANESKNTGGKNQSKPVSRTPNAGALTHASDDIGPQHTWTSDPPGDVWQRLQACNEIKCFETVMREAGASSQAIEVARLLNRKVYATNNQLCYLTSFKEMGKVDLADGLIPSMANSNDRYLLVNGTPKILDVGWSLNGKKTENQIRRDALYPSLIRRYPNLGLSGYLAYESMQKLTSGGQRFIFNFYMVNGCRACSVGHGAHIAYDFDVTGKFLGTTLLGITKEGVKWNTKPPGRSSVDEALEVAQPAYPKPSKAF